MRIKKCNYCGTYTMKDLCPKCNKPTKHPQPPKFSPEDKYGKWRRLEKVKQTGFL